MSKKRFQSDRESDAEKHEYNQVMQLMPKKKNRIKP